VFRMEQEYDQIVTNLFKKGEVDAQCLDNIKDRSLFAKCLGNKKPSVKLWNKFFADLHKLKKKEIVTEVCKLLSSEKTCIKEDPEKENKTWIQVYNKVVLHYLTILTTSNDPKVIEEYSKLLMSTLSKSDRLDVLDSSLFVGTSSTKDR